MMKQNLYTFIFVTLFVCCALGSCSSDGGLQSSDPGPSSLETFDYKNEYFSHCYRLLGQKTEAFCQGEDLFGPVFVDDFPSYEYLVSESGNASLPPELDETFFSTNGNALFILSVSCPVSFIVGGRAWYSKIQSAAYADNVIDVQISYTLTSEDCRHVSDERGAVTYYLSAPKDVVSRVSLFSWTMRNTVPLGDLGEEHDYMAGSFSVPFGESRHFVSRLAPMPKPPFVPSGTTDSFYSFPDVLFQPSQAYSLAGFPPSSYASTNAGPLYVADYSSYLALKEIDDVPLLESSFFDRHMGLMILTLPCPSSFLRGKGPQIRVDSLDAGEGGMEIRVTYVLEYWILCSMATDDIHGFTLYFAVSDALFSDVVELVCSLDNRAENAISWREDGKTDYMQGVCRYAVSTDRIVRFG